LEKQNTISGHIIQFCRFLRAHKFNLGPAEESLSLEALSTLSLSKASYFKNCLRSTLVKNKVQLDLFDDLYLRYWAEIRRAENAKQKEVPEKKDLAKPPAKAPSLQVIKNWLYSNHHKDKLEIASHDTFESSSLQDFSALTKTNVSEALRYTRQIAKKLSNRKSTRYVASKKKEQVDLHRIIRSNLFKSDELVYLRYRKRKIGKLKIVLICDVSRSMEVYSKFLIQFIYGLNQASTRIETFVFSTRLERITSQLKEADFKKVLAQLPDSFYAWSGGTKIGASLQEFAENHASYLLDRKTKVMILSDGWDTGDEQVVDAAMSTIKRKCKKVIWLNPLAGNANFKAETACLKAALPYVDIFHAANSVDDLRELLKLL